MAEAPLKVVKIGNTDHRITPFRAYKAILAGRIVARVSKQVSEMMEQLADFNIEYREKHKLRITREMAEARKDVDPGYAVMLEGALKNAPFIDLPQAPTFEEQAMSVFASAFQFAEGELMQMVGLALIPNEELKGAWRMDAVFEQLNEYGVRIFEEAEIGELVDLVVAVEAVLRDQLAPRAEGLGKLRALYARQDLLTEEAPTPSSSKPSTDSSTASPKVSDGPRSTSSSALLGVD